jgi:hypothetical protein
MLKEIIRDNLLFDKSNPSMIVRDAPLEAALGRREVDVNKIRGVVQRQLLLVEAGPGPLAESMLAESLAMLRGASSNPRSISPCRGGASQHSHRESRGLPEAAEWIGRDNRTGGG